MCNQINNTFPSLQLIASYDVTRNAPQYTLSFNFKNAEDQILRHLKEAWDSLKEGASQLIGPNHIMLNLEKDLIKYYCCQSEKYKIYSVDLSYDKKENLLINNVKILFQSLAQKLGVPLNYIDWRGLQKKWEAKAFDIVWTKAIYSTNLKDVRPFTKITTLDLSKCRIKAIPSQLQHFKYLSVLILEFNEIKCIPNFLGKLPNLVTLQLRNNDITCISDSIGDCKKLQFLDLSHNKITSIPDSMIKLTELSELYLEDNKISKIPSFLLSLKKLELLALYRNPLFLHLNIRESKKDGLSLTREAHKIEFDLKIGLTRAAALNEYKCAGRYSNFIRLTLHAFSTDQHDAIKDAFNTHLESEEKDLIRKAFSLITQSFGNFKLLRDEHLWKDMHAYCEACVIVVTLKLKNLSPDEIEFISILMEKMEEPDPSSNILLLSDVMEELGRYDLTE